MIKKITHAIHDFKYGVRNLIDWFPIVWRDRDWDYHFLLKILAFKLRRIAKSTKDWISADADKVSVQTQFAAHIIEDVIMNDYHEMTAFDQHEDKWGASKMSSTPLPDKPGWSELHLRHPKANTPELQEQEGEEFRERMRDARKNHERDIDKLFEILRGFEGWWD